MSQRTIIIIAGIVFFVIAFIVLLFMFGRKDKEVIYHTNLEVWGVFDTTSDYSDIFDAYTAAHPYVDGIQYRKFTVDTYKEDLINALAAGNNPDIFMIHNTWLPDFADKVVPAPEYLINEQTFRNAFVDVAAQDSIISTQIYAVPLSVDSLALYYNKNIFNAAGITQPPATWEDFNRVVAQLTQIDDQSNAIIRSGATIGTAENVNRAEDILTVLMMQGGAKMEENGVATFDKSITIGGQTRTPGKRALQYYTQFARIGSEVYTWNNIQHWSLDAFSEEQAAMTINYSYHYDTLKSKNEKLRFAVAPLPQFRGSSDAEHVGYANYWMFVVAKNKSIPKKTDLDKEEVAMTNDMRIHEAWQFLRALTLPNSGSITLLHAVTGASQTAAVPYDFATQYLEKTRKPAARKDLIEKQKTDVRLAPFVAGNLIARSWRHPNAEAVERTIAQMITQVNTGEATVDQALRLGAQRATQLMK